MDGYYVHNSYCTLILILSVLCNMTEWLLIIIITIMHCSIPA